MADDIQIIDYSNSPSGNRNSPAPGRVSTKSPALSKPPTPIPNSLPTASNHDANSIQSPSKYSALLTVIEELGRDVRPTYAGNKLAAERLKRGIVHARVLTRECLAECDRINRSTS